MNMSMWSATVNVSPLPEHPQYWEMGFGWLVVYLTGGTMEEAAMRAAGLAGLLWYKVESTRIEVIEAPPYPREVGLRQVYDEAILRGLSWLVVACPTGAE